MSDRERDSIPNRVLTVIHPQPQPWIMGTHMPNILKEVSGYKLGTFPCGSASHRVTFY